MKPIYIYGMVLVLLALLLAALGVVLTKVNWLRPRQARSYARIATLLLLSAAYGMVRYDWPGVHLRQIDLWSLLVIFAILGYSLIRAALNFPLSKVSHSDFSKSYMLSMLYSDSEQMREEDMQGRAYRNEKSKDGH